MTVQHLAVNDVLLSKGVVGDCVPGTAVDGQSAVADIADGVN